MEVHFVSFRFREWGSSDWTYISVDGELDEQAASIIGSAFGRFHCQQFADGKWENL